MPGDGPQEGPKQVALLIQEVKSYSVYRTNLTCTDMWTQ